MFLGRHRALRFSSLNVIFFRPESSGKEKNRSFYFNIKSFPIWKNQKFNPKKTH